MSVELHRMAGADMAVDAGYGPPRDHNQSVKACLDASFEGLLDAQDDEGGYWCYEFEADATVPAEYVLMTHFMGEIDEVIEEHGGWPGAFQTD